MIRKFFIIFFLLINIVYLNGYELPEVKVNSTNRPEIVIFTASSIVLKDKPSYEIRWKTLNSTDVQLTFIGKVKTSGSVIITKEEYDRGPITLTASNRESSHSDSKTINMHKKNDDEPVVIFKSSEPEVEPYHYYNTMPYRRRLRPGYRRRYY